MRVFVCMYGYQSIKRIQSSKLPPFLPVTIPPPSCYVYNMSSSYPSPSLPSNHLLPQPTYSPSPPFFPSFLISPFSCCTSLFALLTKAGRFPRNYCNLGGVCFSISFFFFLHFIIVSLYLCLSVCLSVSIIINLFLRSSIGFLCFEAGQQK